MQQLVHLYVLFLFLFLYKFLGLLEQGTEHTKESGGSLSILPIYVGRLCNLLSLWGCADTCGTSDIMTMLGQRPPINT